MAYSDQMGNTTTYEYDTQGNMLSETDPLGRTRSYTYEWHGWMTSSTDWSLDLEQPGPVTSYEYDFKGHLTRTVYPDGTSTAATYDAAGNMLTETDPLGRVTTYTYDGFGRMLSRTASSPSGSGTGATTSYAYDAAGRLQTETGPDGMTSYTYNWRGNVTGVTHNGTTTKYVYNAVGMLRSQSNAQHQTWYYTYDSVDNLLKTIGPVTTTNAQELTGIPGPAADDAPTTEFQYDDFNRQTQTIDALGNVTEYATDAMGRVIDVTDPAGNVTSYEYDRNGRQVRLIQPSPDGTAPELVTIWQYDAAGQLVSTIDPLGRVTQTVYDVAGNVQQQVQPAPAPGMATPVTAYTYDVMGRVLTMTDPLGRVTRYAYFADGQLRQVRQPDGVTVDASYTYDDAGNLETATDALGETTHYVYNGAGQLESETDPRGFVTSYSYDMFGNLQQVSRHGSMGMWSTTQYTYDTNGRLQTESRPGEGTSSYTYDAFGHVLTQTDGMGRQTQYSYDVLGRLSQVLDPLGKPTDYQYDDVGNLTQVTDRNRYVTQYAYDRLNRRTSVTAPAAGTRTTRYDAVGNVIGQTDGLGHETLSTYDRLNRLTSVRDPLGGLTSYTYDAVGNRLTERDPLGNVVYTTYDAFDRPTMIGGFTATPTGDVWSGESYTYDAAGNVLTHTDSRGIVDTYEYDETGNVKNHTDAADKITRYTYDPLGNVLTVTLPAPAANQPTPVYQYEYDQAGRRTKERSPLGNERQWMYNNAGEVIFEQVEGTLGTTFEYYADGSLKWRLDQNTDKTQYTYDDMGNLLTVESPLHRITRYTYDAAGRRLTERDAANALTQYTYYADGNLHTLTDPVGNVSTFGYDAAGRQTSDTNAQGTRTFSYDAAGQLSQMQDRNGRLRRFDWQFAYDGSSNYRKLDEIWLVPTTLPGYADPVLLPKSIITYAYNAAGQLQAVTDANSGVAYTYDALGRVASTSESGGSGTPVTTLTNTYDNLGRRTGVSTTVGSGALMPLVYGYDADSRLTSIREKLVFNQYLTFDYIAVDLSYRPDSRLNQVNRSSGYFGGGPGVQSQYGYDTAGRLTSLNHMLTGGYGLTYTYNGMQMSVNGALTALSWEYNADGQITASHRGVQVGAWDAQIVNENRSYTYDAAGQLTGVATSQTYLDGSTASSTQAYGYDPNGNRDTAGYDTDPGNLMVSDGAHTYTYDAEGNRVSMTEIATGAATLYTWDYRNRLTGVTTKNGAGQVQKAITYTYDAFDRRISKTLVDSTGGYPVTVTERYVYDGTDLVLVLDGDGLMQHRFLHGPEVDQVFADETSLGNLLWLLEDNQHSIVNVVAMTGAPDHPHWSYQSYDAFGNQTVSDPSLATAIAYTGQVWDPDAKLYYYKARWYDAVTGRFVSSDPLGFAAGDTNLQRYVANDPINFVDPSGKEIRETSLRGEAGQTIHYLIVTRRVGKTLGLFGGVEETVAVIAYEDGDTPNNEEVAREAARVANLPGGLKALREEIGGGIQIVDMALRIKHGGVDFVSDVVELVKKPSFRNGVTAFLPVAATVAVGKLANRADDANDAAKTAGTAECASAKEMKVGEAGHHVPAVRKSQGRPFSVERGDKTRPTFHVVGDENAKAQAHWRMHNAERQHVGPRQGDFHGTDKELFDAYRKSYKELKDIRVDVRSPDGKTVLGTNVTLEEAINLIEKYLAQ